MADNNLVKRISELPLCEDISILDTLIGIGTDGKTYRVNKDNIGTGGSSSESGGSSSETGEYVELGCSATNETNTFHILLNDVNTFFDLFAIGGRLHVICNYTESYGEMAVIDFNFLMGSNFSVSDEMSGSTYYYFDTSETVLKNYVFRLHLNLTYQDGREQINSFVIQSYENGTQNNKCESLTIHYIYFEPLPFINIVTPPEEEGPPV